MNESCVPLLHTVKKELGSPNEEWGVDQQLISKLKEEYKKERKTRKTSKFPFKQTMYDHHIQTYGFKIGGKCLV